MSLHLPELPPFILPLTRDEDIEHVDALTKGWWHDPSQCRICGGHKTFRWKARDSVEWWAQTHGMAGVAADDIYEYECPCNDQWVLYRRLLLSNIPFAYQRLSIWDMASDAHRGFLMEHLTKLETTVPNGLGLLLRGEHGTGKTMTAALLAKGAFAMGYSVYYSTFAGLIDRYSETWKNEARKAYFKTHITGASLLVIDDVGREMRQSYQAQVSNLAKGFISDVLRDRFQNEAPTYMTSNLTLTDLAGGYGMDVFSLLQERTETRDYTGVDFRPQARARIEAESAEKLSRPVVLGVYS